MDNKLAILGGKPAVQIDRPHYIWPDISDSTEQAVNTQLHESISIYNRSGIIETLEDRLAIYHARKHAVLTNSGTNAIHSMYVGTDLGPEEEVIMPAYTFFASATPLLFTGAVPIFVDCDKTGNIDPIKIREKISCRTSAIAITHMWGIPCDMEEIMNIADYYHLPVLEDGSHAHGATYHNKPIGSFGNAAAFSMQGQKTLTGGEGGYLVTNDDEVYYRSLLLGHYNKRCKQEIPSDNSLHQFSVTGMGLKYRIHPLAAAIANQQLDTIDTVLTGRRKNAKEMQTFFSQFEGISVPQSDDDVQPSWYAFVLQFEEESVGVSLDKFYAALHAEGAIEFDRPGSMCPLNLHPLFQQPEGLFRQYKDAFNYKPGDFPTAETFHSQALKLPVWHNERDSDIMNAYLAAFKKVYENKHNL